VVAAYAVMLAIFVGQTFVDPPLRQYAPEFGAASWIQLKQPGEAAYFRKTLYLPGPPELGSLMVAATGNFTLYVNNVDLGQVIYPGARVSGIYDLKTLLVPGKNVIAIHVAGGTFATPPQIRVRGMYKVKGGVREEFISDSSWKASETPDGVIGGYGWTAPELEDRLWADAATAAGGEAFSTVQRLTADPALFAHPPDGEWIQAPSFAAGRTSFVYDLTLKWAVRQVWIQVAATGGYDLFVNNRLGAMVADNDWAAVFGPRAPIPMNGQLTRESATMPRMIGPWTAGVSTQDLNVVVPQIPPSKPPQEAPPSAPAASILQPNPQVPNSVPIAPLPPHLITAGAANSIVTGFSFASPAPTPTPAPPPRTARPAHGLGTKGAAENGPVGTPTPAVAISSRPVSVTGDTQAEDEAVAPPELAGIAAPNAPLAPQPYPLFSTIGVLPASPAMIAYNLSNLFHAGVNRITIRVHSSTGSPAILVDGLVDLGSEKQYFGSHADWLTLGSASAAIASKDSSVWQHAVVLGQSGSAPAGLIPQVVAFSHLLPGDDARLLWRWTVAVTLTLAVVFLLWGLAAPLFASNENGSQDDRVEELWSADALTHLPMLILIAGVWLSSYDVRLPYEWCFRPVVIFALAGLLLLSKLLLLGRSAPELASRDNWPRRVARWGWQAPALVVLMIAGLIVRASGLAEPSLSHDEVSVIRMVEGVLKIGFPYITTGSFVRYAATYELLPYPIALFKLFFGNSAVALRMPALIFGTLTVGLIGWAGRRMMDWRVGLTAAAIYAFLPAPILHSQDLFYPAQESFFALLAIWLFYEAIRGPRINRRYMTYATAAFILTYLSWEGSGFFLPALVVALLACKWGEWDWLADGHLWACLTVVSAVVLIELSWKLIVVIPDYLGVGKDLNDLASPSLVFLNRLVFDPWFYIKSFFFIDNQWLLSILAILGFVFLRRNKAILYLTVLLLSFEVFYTCLLGLYHPKYAYNWTTVLVLAAVGSLFQFYDEIRQIDFTSRKVRFVRGFALAGGIAVLIVFSNPYLVKLYRLAAIPDAPPFDSRLGISFSPNYQAEDSYIAKHLEAGDGVMTPAPHVFAFDTGIIPDYTMNTMLSYRYYYDGGQPAAGFIDRSIGVPLILDLHELERARAKYKRLWIVERNIRIDAETPDITNYLLTYGRVVYESDLQSVVLINGIGAGVRADSGVGPAAASRD